MAYINSLEIDNFRGIQQLSISDFSNINIIAGDNNSGKTTLLEALQLLFAKPNLGSVKSIINQRTALSINGGSFYTSFIKTFNMGQDKNQLEYSVYAQSNVGAFAFEIRGKEKTISGEDALQVSTMSASQKSQYKRASAVIPEKVQLFDGAIVTNRGKKTIEKNIKCTSLDSGISSIQLEKDAYYISSFGHLRYDLLQNIVDNPDYKKLTIDILKQFDNSIEDICYTKSDDGSFLETIITKEGVNMPFSVYGDGMKKILYILNKIFDASDSILLIDEIETGLHKKYFETLFPVIFALAKKLNVQLFIATHSIEAIDAILEYGNYEYEIDEKDPIRVITLKKDESDNGNNILVRNLPGKSVFNNRNAFSFEVRL